MVRVKHFSTSHKRNLALEINNEEVELWCSKKKL